MKREPNPYSKNPMLTVTSTMSISVPSMVAEDVLDGDADKITGVDPEALNEIRAEIAEVVETTNTAASDAKSAKQTALSVVQEFTELKQDMDRTSRLAYGLQGMRNKGGELYVDAKDGSGLVYLRVSGNGKHVEVTVDDLQNLVDGTIGGGGGGSSSGAASNIQTEGLAYAQIRYDYSSDSLAIKANNDRGTGLNYYKLAAKGLVSSDYPNAQLRLYGNDSGVVELQLSGDYGRTWSNLGEGGSSSGSGSASNPDTEFVHGSLSHYDPALVFETESSSEDWSYVNNYYNYKSNAGVAIILGKAPSGSNLAYPIITPGIINAANRNCRLTWIDKTNKGGDSAIWDLQYTTDGGRNWNSLGVGSGSGGGAETVRYTGNQYPYLALHLHSTGCLSFTDSYGETLSNIVASAITNFDKNCYLAIGVNNNTLEFFNGAKYVTIVDENGNLTSSSGGSNIVTTTSSGVAFIPGYKDYDHLIMDYSDGECINFVTQRADDGYSQATGLEYGLRVALAAFDDPTVKLRLSGGISGTPVLQVKNGEFDEWEDFVISGGSSNSGTSSSSSSNTVTFGPIDEGSEQYELSLALNDWRTDSASAIVELKEPTDSYQGVAALGAYLAAPASSYYDNTNYDRGVLMAVSGMGTLVFRRNSEVVKYDLNNLGGTGAGESNGSGESTVGTPTSIATYINESANGSISNYDVTGEFKVLRGSGRNDSASGVVTLYLEDADGDYISGVSVLLNAALTAGRSSSSGSDRYLYGGIRPVINTDNTLTWEYLALDGHSWTPVSSGDSGGSTTVTTTSSGVSFVPFNDGYMGYNQFVIDQSSGNHINFVTQSTNGNVENTGLWYGLQAALASFDDPTVKLRFAGSSTSPKLQVLKGWDSDWEDFVISGSSNSNSDTTATTGELIIPQQYSGTPCAMQVQDSDDSSIVIALYSKDSDFNGITALNCGLAYDDPFAGSTTMTVHGMGKLLFKSMSNAQVFDLNNLGGTGSSSGSSGGSSSSDSTAVSFKPAYDAYNKFIIDHSSDGHISFETQRVNGHIEDTGLAYGLQVALAAFDHPEVKLRLAGSSLMPVLQVKKGWDADWEDFAISGGSASGSTNGTLPLYSESSNGVREEGALSIFTFDNSKAASDDSIIIELRAEGSDYELSRSQIALNAALTTVNEGGYSTGKALRIYDDTELDCVKWQLRSKDNPNNWSDAPIAATVLLSDSRYHSYSSYKPLTVSIHADGWLNVENRIKSKSHTIPFEDLAWLCANIDKLKALVN